MKDRIKNLNQSLSIKIFSPPNSATWNIGILSMKERRRLMSMKSSWSERGCLSVEREGRKQKATGEYPDAATIKESYYNLEYYSLLKIKSRCLHYHLLLHSRISSQVSSSPRLIQTTIQSQSHSNTVAETTQIHRTASSTHLNTGIIPSQMEDKTQKIRFLKVFVPLKQNQRITGSNITWIIYDSVLNFIQLVSCKSVQIDNVGDKQS
ncbi:hypothetical protein Glove_117g369 [Diversispora epigaea]|uniref:Uncharacterized protein n=1 Tax=Diversispora epigaea TaxID=1348612 RepID=A0A397J079_9GLOM|nr:hypothetical protein Glove_117g369 [Diversispora epigaea]